MCATSIFPRRSRPASRALHCLSCSHTGSNARPTPLRRYAKRTMHWHQSALKHSVLRLCRRWARFAAIHAGNPRLHLHVCPWTTHKRLPERGVCMSLILPWKPEGTSVGCEALSEPAGKHGWRCQSATTECRADSRGYSKSGKWSCDSLRHRNS